MSWGGIWSLETGPALGEGSCWQWGLAVAYSTLCPCLFVFLHLWVSISSPTFIFLFLVIIVILLLFLPSRVPGGFPAGARQALGRWPRWRGP